MTGPEQSLPGIDSAENARAADADREAIAGMLRIAAGEGRLDLDELDDRISLAYQARTYGQLQALITDLPGPRTSTPHHLAVPEPETLVLKTTSAILKQSGQWTVPRRLTVESRGGFITLDFTRASCAHREITVDAVTRSGRIRLILPDGWAARISPSSTNTSHIKNGAAQTARPDGTTIILTGHPLSGYIKVKQRRRRRPAWRLRRARRGSAD
jgi:uncharacterized protein DUF1707